MREELLHFIWKYKKLQLIDLVTSKNESISIIDVGSHNHLAGPDFFNAQVQINGQLWAGNVEIHIKSSDWFAHHHEADTKYDNVILHVVWEDDASVFRKDNSEIPTVALKNYVSPDLLKAYQRLFDASNSKFINCEHGIAQVDTFLLENWLERLYFERLERKSTWLVDLLDQSNNDWEKVLFVMLLKNFGLKINGESFMSIGQALDYSIVRKLYHNTLQFESVLFGLAGFLNEDGILDVYYAELVREFEFLQKKFDIQSVSVQKPDFFKLRPPNFPTIRLSQLANLYGRHPDVFRRLIDAKTLNELYSVFELRASGYWDTHFSFGKESKKQPKKMTRSFMDLLIINTALPLKFCYARHMGKDCNEEIVAIVSQIKKEKNNVIEKFGLLGIKLKSAKDSQACLQLYNEYCTKNRCLQCAVGNSLLRENV